MNITREGSGILKNGCERTKSPNRPFSLFANTVRGACMSGARLKRSRSPQCLPRWARFVFERHGTARYSLRRNGNPYKNTPKAALSAYRKQFITTERIPVVFFGDAGKCVRLSTIETYSVLSQFRSEMYIVFFFISIISFFFEVRSVSSLLSVATFQLYTPIPDASALC